jgi:ABC-type multidrug transport system ATPase subunit
MVGLAAFSGSQIFLRQTFSPCGFRSTCSYGKFAAQFTIIIEFPKFQTALADDLERNQGLGMTLTVEKGLTIGYRKQPVATVTEELTFRAAEVTLLLGLNGQGKTTFIKTLAGLLPPLSGKSANTRVLYLSDDVDFPVNLTPLEIVTALAPTTETRTLGQEMLQSLEVEKKKYGLLSKGNRQKARIVFAEVVSRARNVNFLGMDEPFSGLDFQAREYLVDRWLENPDQTRHLLVSMHPSEIPVQPSQILLVSRGEIWTVPPSTPWPQIRALLQQPVRSETELVAIC